MAEPADDQPSGQQLLAIYLHDHRAGAAAGVQLARRAHRHAGSGPLAATLAWLETEVDQDRQTLDSIMQRLGVKQSSWKTALGVAAERAGRLKLNGRLLKRSPLSSLLELEALTAAVAAKRDLWHTLAALAEGAPDHEDHGLAGLIERADDQLARLHAHHADAARAAFEATPPPPSTTTPPSTPTATSGDVAARPPLVDVPETVLQDAEGGIEGSLLDAPDEA